MKHMRRLVLYMSLGAAVLGLAALTSCDWLGQNVPPVAGFSLTPEGGFAPLTILCDASLSLDPDGEIRSYKWDFGDGNTDSGLQCSHTYLDDGEYTICLDVKDQRGVRTQTEQVVTVLNSPPIPRIEASLRNGSSPPVMDFSAGGSTDADGEIASYRWDFGDGTVELGQDVSHEYDITGEGTFEVTLAVVDDDGAEAIASVTVAVPSAGGNAAPTAQFDMEPGYGTVPFTVELDGSASSDSDGTISSYVWVIGGDIVLQGERVTHLFSSPGEHEVILTVTDDNGASASARRTIIANFVMPSPPPPPGS